MFTTKRKRELVGNTLMGIGFVLFILRGFVSTVNPNEPFARDLFGFPMLELGQNSTIDVWLSFVFGALTPFVFIGVGTLVKRHIGRIK